MTVPPFIPHASASAPPPAGFPPQPGQMPVWTPPPARPFNAAPPPPAVQAPPTPATVPAEPETTGPAHEVDRFLYRCLEMDGSDLHLTAGTCPWVSAHGDTNPMGGMVGDLDAERIEELLRPLVPAEQWETFQSEKRLDFSYATPRSRFRAHYAIAGGAPMAVFRAIPTVVPDFDTLGLPDVVRDVVDLESGLVIFVGTTGSGKSSSLAALIKLMKDRHARKIVTLENPVEFRHTPGRSLIVQREIGTDVRDFATGIEDALREAPDVILIGEMRDPETMAAAVTAASSGHLVLATLHAESTSDAPTRILDSMPGERVSDVRSQLSRSLRTVVYQKLLPIKGGGGRVLASEVLKMSPAISNLIRSNDLGAIPGQMIAKDSGCITFEQSLVNLVHAGKVNESTARRSEIRDGSFDRQMGHRRAA